MLARHVRVGGSGLFLDADVAGIVVDHGSSEEL
jgi:hypothetical protein